jgi:hypothetical protein
MQGAKTYWIPAARASRAVADPMRSTNSGSLATITLETQSNVVKEQREEILGTRELEWNADLVHPRPMLCGKMVAP